MSKLCSRYTTALISCVLFLTYNITYAQTVSDTLQLDEIEVVATRIQQPLHLQPTNIHVIDSTRLELLESLSVAEMLASQSSLVIKEYGPGGLAIASQRGLSSEQIQVLWEGIPINTPMQGQVDLSLLPTQFFSDIQVSSGTPSTAFGGGSLSGALYLGSDWQGPSYLSVKQEGGSFGQWQSSLQGRYQENGLLVSVKSLYDYAKNDFKYYNRAYNRFEKREHNRSERSNVMASVGKKGNNGRWKTTFWWGNSDNHLPGSILSSNSRARREDKTVRWLSSYHRQLGKAEWSVKNYLSRLGLNYFDPATGTQSFSTTRRWMVSSNVSYPVKQNILLKGEISGELTGVETNNYTSDKYRQQFSILTNPELVFWDQQLRIYPALRLDVYSDFGSVVSPSLGINYELIPYRMYVRGQLSRDFNPPTFNALYWGQSGNPNLKAERSNGSEIGIKVTPGTRLGITSLDLTAYVTRVDNGIRWYPNNNGVYVPQNVQQVTTKGIEAQLKNRFIFGQSWQLNFNQQATLTRSEISEARFPGDEAVGNQARYIPQWKYNGSLKLRKGIGTALLQYRWVSRRYVTEEESRSSSLDPYQVLDARIQLQKQVGGIDVTARAGINNILNENYEVVQWYAMPQRNFTFSITATYQF
jgi:iron complex outermembrane receptor protein